MLSHRLSLIPDAVVAPRASRLPLSFPLSLFLFLLTACPGSPDAHCPEALSPTPFPSVVLSPCVTAECWSRLRIHEVMSNNEGAWVDEDGHTDDWIELYNPGNQPISLVGFAISDRMDERHVLTSGVVPAQGTELLWADDDVAQGPLHLPFKLSSGGEEVFLWSPTGILLDQISVPALEPNQSALRLPTDADPVQVCGFATPTRVNGETCGPPSPPSITDDTGFCPFVWPEPWPAPASPVTLNELSFELDSEQPAQLELLNTGSRAVDLQSLSVRLASLHPGDPWPTLQQGTEWPLPAQELQRGAHLVITVSPVGLRDLRAAPALDWVLSLYERSSGRVLDRFSLLSWPSQGVLAREPEGHGSPRFCLNPSLGEANPPCDPLMEREIGTYLRTLQTPGDFERLSLGDPTLGIDGVKVIVDLEREQQVYFIDSLHWDLHYTFVREMIEGQPHLDRCDPEEAALFNEGWGAFSEQNYFTVEGRRYLLGTLVHHGSNDLRDLEFSTGDVIVGTQMQTAFFATAREVLTPSEWVIRASDARQVEELRALSGTVPAVGPNAIFEGMDYQPLNEGVTYGVLTWLPAAELERAVLGAQVLVMTDAVPLDIDLVAGLITEAFQTPLSHVAVLSRNRGTPNMALTDAHTNGRLSPYLGKLVRFEVGSGDFSIREATPEEAQVFWEAQGGEQPPQVPALDLSLRGVVPLEGRGLEELPALGAKAAQLGELKRLAAQQGEDLPIRTPRDAFAIPVLHEREHFEASGAGALLWASLEDPAFQSSPAVREQVLAEMQALIQAFPVDPILLSQVTGHIHAVFGEQRMRFRSSSNTEDIPGFSGAGLYTSLSGQLGNPDETVEDAIRGVWASLWNARAYEERAYYRVDQASVAMAVLVHEAFQNEKANGVAISRNVLDPTRSSYYTNVQFGEASVTNPAPGVTADELLYRWGTEPPERYLAYSSFRGGVPVLSREELDTLELTLKVIHNGFKTLLDPENEDAYFAMDIEFKLLGVERSLLVKQARPYSYGRGVTDACND